jgi:alpha-L-fucosidase
VLRLPSIPVRVTRASLLHGAQLQFDQSRQDLKITVPAGAVDPVDTIIRLELEQPWTTQAVVPVPSR